MGENTPNTPFEVILSQKSRNKEAKRYSFTYNNYDKNKLDEFNNTLNTLGKYIYGFEVGESGTPHLQGYINLYTKKTLSSLKNHLGIKSIHLEACRGSEKNNIDYCSKDGNYKSNFVEEKFIEDIVSLYEWEIILNNILISEPDKRTLYYIFESDGCKGKTTYQKYVFCQFKDVVVLSGKGSDMKNGIVTYKEKNGKLPKIILINIPRESYDFVSWTGIEEVKDMFFYSGKYEGGMICGKCPHVLIFANEPPPIKKVSKDRWQIYEIIDNNFINYKEKDIDESSI